MDISLADLPVGSGISFDLLGLDAVDINKVNEQLSTYSDRKFSTAPLLAFKATKNGLENGKDILGATFTFTVPGPPAFDPSATYYVVRENDGAYDILNATLISSADADPRVVRSRIAKRPIYVLRRQRSRVRARKHASARIDSDAIAHACVLGPRRGTDRLPHNVWRVRDRCRHRDHAGTQSHAPGA